MLKAFWEATMLKWHFFPYKSPCMYLDKWKSLDSSDYYKNQTMILCSCLTLICNAAMV